MAGPLSRWWDSDIAYSWRSSPVAVAATITLLVLLVGSLGAD